MTLNMRNVSGRMTNRFLMKTACVLSLALTASLAMGVSLANTPTRWPQVIESGNPATSGIVYYQLSTGQKLYEIGRAHV